MVDGKGNPFSRDWIHKNPADVEPSGWVFEFNNQWNPDVDDTAMVLLALRKIPTDNRKSATNVSSAAEVDDDVPVQRRRLASFDKDCTKNILEKVPFADHKPMLDPNAPTSPRASWNCSATKAGAQTIPRSATRWFTSRAAGRGRFLVWPLGRELHYGTWQVLRGLRAMNIDMQQPWLLKARAWLESVQHKDGGWGERCNTYDDPVFKAAVPAPPRKPPGPSWVCAPSATRTIPRSNAASSI